MSTSGLHMNVQMCPCTCMWYVNVYHTYKDPGLQGSGHLPWWTTLCMLSLTAEQSKCYLAYLGQEGEATDWCFLDAAVPRALFCG